METTLEIDKNLLQEAIAIGTEMFDTAEMRKNVKQIISEIESQINVRITQLEQISLCKQ